MSRVDLHADNLLIELTDDSILSTIEESEISKPSPRKQIGDTTIHVSQYVLGGAGALTMSDMGQARVGPVHTGNAMPVPYRAPEVILNMPWGTPVDIWSTGLLVGSSVHYSTFDCCLLINIGLDIAHAISPFRCLRLDVARGQ